MATRQLRVKMLAMTAVTAWLLGLSPLGKLPRGAFLLIGLGCSLQLLQESEGLMYDEAIAKVNKSLNQKLDAKTLALQTIAAEQELEAQYNTQPEQTYQPEVLEELKQSLEYLVQETAARNEEKLTTSEVDQKALYLAIKSLLAVGKSETFIIEEILKLGGNNWKFGKQRLQQILELGESNEWQ